ncbi:MAG TPA: hypothetical protein VGP44_11305 [Gemmatimonadales bacterium]|nr:hypothetical protein [Gemmatimonadales bacterium]
MARYSSRLAVVALATVAPLSAVDALADLRSFGKVGFVMKGGVVYKGP